MQAGQLRNLAPLPQHTADATDSAGIGHASTTALVLHVGHPCLAALSIDIVMLSVMLHWVLHLLLGDRISSCCHSDLLGLLNQLHGCCPRLLLLPSSCPPDGSFVIRPAELARGCSLQAALVPFFTVGARPNLPAARNVAVEATMICRHTVTRCIRTQG